MGLLTRTWLWISPGAVECAEVSWAELTDYSLIPIPIILGVGAESRGVAGRS